MFATDAPTTQQPADEADDVLTPEGDSPLTLAEYTEFIREIEAQPSWRGTAFPWIMLTQRSGGCPCR